MLKHSRICILLFLAASALAQTEAAHYPNYTETRNYTQTPEAQYAHAIAANTQAATGINNIYSLIVALLAGAGLIAKDFKDRKQSKVTEDDFRRFDDRIKKLFDYHDAMVKTTNDIEKEVVRLRDQDKLIITLQTDFKEMTKTMTSIQKDISKLVAMQEHMLHKKDKAGYAEA